MTRAATATLCILVIGTSPGFAQNQPIGTRPVSAVPAPPEPTAAGVDLSPQAAGIDRIVAADIRERHPDERAIAATPQTTQAAKKKSAWKTPWPYVAIVAVAGAVVLLRAFLCGGDEGTC